MHAGLKTLNTQGFYGCTVQDITQAAQVPKGSFYNHFESKEALAMEALELFWTGGDSRRAILSDKSIDPVERLRLHFQKLTKLLASNNYEIGCLIGNFSSEMARHPEFQERLARIYRDWSLVIERCIDEISTAGRLRIQAKPGILAGFLVSAWEGAVLRAKVERNGAAFEEFEQVTLVGFFS
ncbi:TetR family transcriptional regulator C-terminal domain-containing protein [uncultured Marinobacter sp.]|uniref:TetR/AcrR family transcriptional regulator n=1 Tax=uncultured Marinobacter sp. TaxID=187379 RepID=UPI0030D6E4A9